MRTLITTEFPRVLEAAGLPLVRSLDLSFDPTESVVFAKRISSASQFLDTAWVAMALSHCTFHPRPNNTARHLRSLPLRIRRNAR